MLCNIFVKYVLTLQPINKGQCRATNYLPTSGLLFIAKAGKLSFKFMVIGFVFLCCWLFCPNFALNTDNNPANDQVIFYIFSNLAHAYIVVGCCRLVRQLESVFAALFQCFFRLCYFKGLKLSFWRFSCFFARQAFVFFNLKSVS